MIDDLFPTLPDIVMFDMDHTLIANDSDCSWKAFLVDKGLASYSALEEAERFYDDYCRGELDVDSFLAYQLREFRGKTEEEMAKLAQEHFNLVVKPLIYPLWPDFIGELRQRGVPLAIVTATNRVVASPAADFFGIEHLLATEPEVILGQFTGGIVGSYCYSEGKIALARQFAISNGTNLATCAYFGDSLSDLPLLKRIGYPFMVNPKPALISETKGVNWERLMITL